MIQEIIWPHLQPSCTPDISLLSVMDAGNPSVVRTYLPGSSDITVEEVLRYAEVLVKALPLQVPLLNMRKESNIAEMHIRVSQRRKALRAVNERKSESVRSTSLT